MQKNGKGLKSILVTGMLMSGVFSYAGPQAMFGLSYTWGGAIGEGNLGLSVKLLSDNEEDNPVVAAGVSYYPWAYTDKFGVDVSAGYLSDSFAITGGWDFLQSDWILSAGYVNTIEENDDDDRMEPSPSGDTEEPPSEEEYMEVE
ncbi:hypothetical protein [Hydrogenimonas sp.]